MCSPEHFGSAFPLAKRRRNMWRFTTFAVCSLAFAAAAAAVRASADEPTTAQQFLDRGIDRSNHNDAAAAEADFSKAIQLDPTNTMAWRWRAVARQTLGNNQGADEDLTQAIRVNPYDNNTFYERAFCGGNSTSPPAPWPTSPKRPNWRRPIRRTSTLAAGSTETSPTGRPRSPTKTRRLNSIPMSPAITTTEPSTKSMTGIARAPCPIAPRRSSSIRK